MIPILPKLSLIVGIAIGSAGCSGGDGDESFTYELLVKVTGDGDPDIELDIGGEALVEHDEGQLSFSYTREFADSDEASDLLVVDIYVDGVLSGSVAANPDECRSSCDSFERAQHTICISESGERVGLCGRLECFSGGQYCGGYIE